MKRVERIAWRYAKSLVKLCEDYKYSYDDVKDDMKSLIELLGSKRKLMFLLKSPIVREDKKIEVFSKVFQLLNIIEGLQKFIKYLIVNHRENMLDDIYFSFSEMVDKKLGRARAKVKSVISLSGEEEAKIKQYLESALGKTIEIESSVDKDIIGGIWIQVGDVVFDGSVKGFLFRLKENLLNIGM
ncbi:MAG: ATP synthase F1 subunit delta [Deltaproteobacteria bacterium]|nr:ATP synthase F1 subunit delta [Deltaproteobacteria bacterium]